MSWTTAQTAANFITRIKRHFGSNPDFGTKFAQSDQEFFDMMNASLDDAHHFGMPMTPEEWTVLTVVGQPEYPMDTGAASHLIDEIGLVTRVDYDGDPLPYRYLYVDEITLRVTGDDNGAPDGWYVREASGVIYLGLAADGVSIGPDEAVTVRVFGWRLSAAITATTGTVKIWRDFYELIFNMMVARVYDRLEQFDQAGYWRNVYVDPGLTALRSVVAARLGRQANKLRGKGIEDYLD